MSWGQKQAEGVQTRDGGAAVIEENNLGWFRKWWMKKSYFRILHHQQNHLGKTMDHVRRIGLLLGTLLWISCSEIPCKNGCPWEGAKSTLRHADGPVNIIGGDPVTTSDWQANHTLVLIGGDGKPFCTATRIGPNQIVTAAHCLDNALPNMSIGYGMTGLPQTKRGYADSDNDPDYENENTALGSKQASPVKVLATAVHPGFVAEPGAKGDSDFYDIGLILFKGELPITVTPIGDFADFPTETSNLNEASTLVKTGYGATSEHDTSAAKLRSVNLQVMRLDKKNFELEYQRKTGRGTCYGDSGGPGFVDDGRSRRLIGITSRGPEGSSFYRKQNGEVPSCDEGNGIDTDARYYRAWLHCTARALQERFSAEGAAIQPLQVRLEQGDVSAKDCAKTRIESLTEVRG